MAVRIEVVAACRTRKTPGRGVVEPVLFLPPVSFVDETEGGVQVPGVGPEPAVRCGISSTNQP